MPDSIPEKTHLGQLFRMQERMAGQSCDSVRGATDLRHTKKAACAAFWMYPRRVPHRLPESHRGGRWASLALSGAARVGFRRRREVFGRPFGLCLRDTMGISPCQLDRVLASFPIAVHALYKHLVPVDHGLAELVLAFLPPPPPIPNTNSERTAPDLISGAVPPFPSNLLFGRPGERWDMRPAAGAAQTQFDSRCHSSHRKCQLRIRCRR